MLYRTATKEDAPQIAALHAASWRTAYREVLSQAYLCGDIESDRLAFWSERLRNLSTGQQVFVAEMDYRILGFACAFLDHDRRWGTFLDNLHVAHDSQRQRIGSGLMAEVARYCTTHASTRGLYVWVVESNRNAQQFYQRLGGTSSGHDYWTPPGGGSVRRLLYTWSILDPLLHRA